MTSNPGKGLAGIVNNLVGGYLTNTQRGPGFCSVCTTPVEAQYEQCIPCSRLPSEALSADQVAPLAYGGHNDQSRQLLFGYKTSTAKTQGDERRLLVALLIASAVQQHRPCMENQLGQITHYVVIPSTGGRRDHPLPGLVRTFLTTRENLVEISAASASAREAGREIVPDRFTLNAADPTDKHMLVIDDTWTTGSNAQSIAWTAKHAGARAVTALVVARWLEPTWPPTRQFLTTRAPLPPYDDRLCPVDRLTCLNAQHMPRPSF